MTAIQTGLGIIEATLGHLLPGKFDGVVARVMLGAIGLQESEFLYHQQVGGPARSYWQFEQAGGIRGVLAFPATSQYAKAVCMLRAVAPTEGDVYAAFLKDDLLACAFARLLLFTDRDPLPDLGDIKGSWDYYQRNWRPGKPRPDDWAGNYIAAQAAVVP